MNYINMHWKSKVPSAQFSSTHFLSAKREVQNSIGTNGEIELYTFSAELLPSISVVLWYLSGML